MKLSELFQSGLRLISTMLLGFSAVIMIASLLAGASAILPSLTVEAQNNQQTSQFQAAEGSCDIKSRITMADILAPAAFFPVIPAECSTTEDGKAVPLSLAVLPDVGIRFFGALVSLIFYLFFFIAVFSGIQWIYGGIDEKQALQAKRNFKDSFLGLVITLSTYLIINTIITSVLQVRFQYTEMNQFFTL